jgi:hypothetical protein
MHSLRAIDVNEICLKNLNGAGSDPSMQRYRYTTFRVSTEILIRFVEDNITGCF